LGTALVVAARQGATECVELLLACGGSGLDLERYDSNTGFTALHVSAYGGRPEMLRLLLGAGADPTVGDCVCHTPLDVARAIGYACCTALLEAAVAEPHRARALFKARSLVDAAIAVPKAAKAARDKGLSLAEEQRLTLAAAPAFLKGRVAWGHELPDVNVGVVEGEEDEELVACVKYVLGLDGGAGMVSELFVELLKMILPKWDYARKGDPLGVVCKDDHVKEEREREAHNH
jgi:hypothetical protein